MRANILVGIYLLGVVAAECNGDNCANHVTGAWLGIGVALETRVSLCNSLLRTTIKPLTTTVTSTVTQFTTDLPDLISLSPPPPTINSTINRVQNQTVIPSSIPTFASAHCPHAGQFSSACACWASAMAVMTTLPQPTVTATRTVYADVGCGPAATGVAGNGTANAYFPCSRRWGTCSCLFSVDDKEVSVEIGPFSSGRGNLTGGPCGEAKECDVWGECEDDGQVCVFDGSCSCGKKECYEAAPNGCEYQGIPMEEFMMLEKHP